MIHQIAKRYSIVSLIGQGGMADVYRAEDMILNRDVAIKVLRSKLNDDPMVLVRFQREASAASRLSHPNVVDIYDVGEYEGMHYIVMEYVRGPTLKQLISRRGALDMSEAVFIMKQLTSAVQHAHEHQIIHRDIKPQNILVKDDGTVKITDFGIAIAADTVQLTFNNAVMGSAHYLAPESAQGQEPDNRVDIYSLGIVFYELLSGQLPFKGKTPTEIAIKHLQQPMPYIRDFNPLIYQSIENIILKATAKDPKARYQSAELMLEDLNRCLQPQYQNVARIKIKSRPVPVVKVEKGHVKIVDYEEPEPEKKKPFDKTYLYIAGGVVACVLLAGILFFAGIIRFDGLFGYEQVPQVASLSLDDALNELKAEGFATDQIEVVEKLSDSVPKGSVVQTSIPAGSIVKADSPMIITISKGPSYLIGDYTGRYLDDVQQELDADGLHLNVQVEYEGVANTNPGIILEQKELNPGDRIDPNGSAKIKFIVAQYPSIVIDQGLIGMDVDEAKTYLNDQGIAVVTRASGYGSGRTVTGVYPPVGTEYTQEGTDSVVTLYYN